MASEVGALIILQIHGKACCKAFSDAVHRVQVNADHCELVSKYVGIVLIHETFRAQSAVKCHVQRHPVYESAFISLIRNAAIRPGAGPDVIEPVICFAAQFCARFSHAAFSETVGAAHLDAQCVYSGVGISRVAVRKMRNIDPEEQSRLIYRSVSEDETRIDIGIDLAAYHGVVDVGSAVKFLVVVKWFPAE